MKRNALAAYLIACGVSGTTLIIPYLLVIWGRKFIPQLENNNNLYFLISPVWGLWNWLYFRLRQPFDIGGWGALLGLIIGLATPVQIYFKGIWPMDKSLGLFLGPVFTALIYYLIWKIIIEPMNKVLGVIR
jgi:hypothetical protein